MICLPWSSRILRYFFLLKWWLFDLTVDFYSLQTSEDHKILESSRWIGRDIRRPPVQSPAQTRVGTNFRPGFSGLCPAGTWKSPGMAPAQPLRVACSTLGCHYGETVSLTVLSKFFIPQNLTGWHFQFLTKMKAVNTSWPMGQPSMQGKEYADTSRLAQALLRTKKCLTRSDCHT